MDWCLPGEVVAGDVVRCGGFYSTRDEDRVIYPVTLGRRADRLVSRAATIMRLLASTAAPTNSAKRSAPSARQRFMPRPRISTRDAPFDAGAKALALLERRRLFVSLALRRFASAALRNADCVDAVIHAGCNVGLAEEAAIRRIEFRRAAECATVTLQ